jgi:hypothetical protein
MRALAGPAMLLVLIGGFGLHRALNKAESPTRDFLDLELAGAGSDNTGACYSLSTVIVANTAFSSAMLHWKPAGENAWTLSMEDLVSAHGGPTHVFQRFTFEQRGDLVHLVSVEASEGQNTEVAANIDGLLEAPNERRSTPTERCLEPGASGYRFARK